MSDSHIRPQRHSPLLTLWATTLISLVFASPLFAWNEHGHEIITRLALASLDKKMPSWLKEPDVQAQILCLSSLPDNWRGQGSPVLDHINNPEHYIDEELLHPYGLTLKTLPKFRREFTDIMATQRALHPEKFPSYDRSKDKDYTRLSPGLLPYRISELHWKTAGNWTLLKTFEQERPLVSDDMIRTTRENIIYTMGILSHYVGDGAQPLHTTEHHHGWTGPNPKGYTKSRRFHSYIDGGVLARHNITAESLLDRVRTPKKIKKGEDWTSILEYIHATWEEVEPLYELEKSGDLKKAPGKAFIENRLLEAASMLSGLWLSAYESGHIDDWQVKHLHAQKRDQGKSEKAPETKPPATPKQPKPEKPVTTPPPADPVGAGQP